MSWVSIGFPSQSEMDAARRTRATLSSFTRRNGRKEHLVKLCAFGLAIAAAITLLRMRASSVPGVVEGWSTGSPVDEIVQVVDAYMRVLDRRPTKVELTRIRKRLQTDATYSTGVLEHQLMLSSERKRRVLTQTNALKTELEGLYSRQQVRLHVRSVYADQVGSSPSAESEQFLTKKYVDSGMNEHELIRLATAISIVPIAGNPFTFGVSSK